MSRCDTARTCRGGDAKPGRRHAGSVQSRGKQRGSFAGSLGAMRRNVGALPLVDGALLALSIGACLAFAGGFVG